MNSYISSSDHPYRNRFLIFGIFLFLLTAAAGTLNIILASTVEKAVLDKKRREERFWQEKIRPAPDYAVLFLGDSRTYRGVNPEITGQILSLKCYNLGFSSGGLNREIFRLAETKLDLSQPRIVIVLGISPLTLSENAYANQHYKTLLTQKDAAPEENETWLQTFFIPMDHERWNIFRKSLKKKKKPERTAKIFFASGWQSIDLPFSRERYDDGLELYRVRFQNYRFSNESLEELTAAVRGWKKRGFHVFAFRPPAPAEMVGIEDALYDETRVKQAFSDAGGIWLDLPADAYQTYDASHLTTESSQRFSRDLAVKIKDCLTDQATGLP